MKKNGSNEEKNRSSKKEGWKLKKSIDKDHNVYARSFSDAKVKCMKDYVKPCICEENPDYLSLHVGANELNSDHLRE